MSIKSKEMGVISVDAGDVVCFSYDEVMNMASECGMGTEAFITQFNGVECGFAADGGYGVDKVTAVQQTGQTYDMILIGGDTRTLRRFLLEGEPNFSEFMENHPKQKEIGSGKDFNEGVFAEIAAEYHASILKHPCNLQGEELLEPRKCVASEENKE